MKDKTLKAYQCDDSDVYAAERAALEHFTAIAQEKQS